MGAAQTNGHPASSSNLHPGEHESVKPGRGGIKPRSWNVQSDSARLSLNGDWQFRFSPTAAISEDFARTDDADSKAWTTMPVPSHWVLHGHGKPAYQNIQYPFPVDPPFVPDQNPTGDYRFAFDLPKDWKLQDGKVGDIMLVPYALLADLISHCCVSMGLNPGQRCGLTARRSAQPRVVDCRQSLT